MVLLVLNKRSELLCIKGLILSASPCRLGLTIGPRDKQAGIGLPQRGDWTLLYFEFKFFLGRGLWFFDFGLVREEVEVRLEFPCSHNRVFAAFTSVGSVDEGEELILIILYRLVSLFPRKGLF